MHSDKIAGSMVPANDLRRQRAIRLAVVEVEGSWRIFLDGRRIGNFLHQTDAIHCAQEIASETRRDGWPVEVLSQQAFGELCVLQPSAPTVQ